MFTNLEEIAVPDVADNFLSGPSWRSAGLLCHPLDQLPISCLITDLTSLQKLSKFLALFLPSWSPGFIQSNSALAASPALFAALEVHSQAVTAAETQDTSLMGCVEQRSRCQMHFNLIF